MKLKIYKDFTDFRDKAFAITPEEAEAFLNDLIKYLRSEKGRTFNNYHRSKGLVYLNVENVGKVYVIGDLHGDVKSLGLIFHRINEIDSNDIIVFLGDYIDRGQLSYETIHIIASLKMKYPENIVMLRGNHEPPENLKPYPHDFPYFLRLKFGSSWKKIYDIFMEIFRELPHAVYAESKLFMVHGGIPTKEHELKVIDEASESKYFPVLEELLWNDPSDYVDYYVPSPRGAGMLFGIRVTREFNRKNNVLAIIRSHEPCEGYKLNHGGAVITVFSRRGPPYFNYKIGYGEFELRKLNNLSDVIKGLRTLE